DGPFAVEGGAAEPATTSTARTAKAKGNRMERGFSPAASRFASGTPFEAEGKGVSEAECPGPTRRRLAEGENVSLRLTPKGLPLHFRRAYRRRHTARPRSPL